MSPLVIIYDSRDDESSMGSDESDQPLFGAVTPRTGQATRTTMRATPPAIQYKGVDWRAIQDALEDATALPRREVRVSLKACQY